MDPVISEDELSVEVDQILDDDFQEVHAVVLELPAELQHAVQVENMRVHAAQLVRVVLLEALDDGALVVALREELGEALQGQRRGGRAGERFDEEVVDDLAGLLALAAVDPENLEEEGLVVGEGGFEPVDAMQKKVEVFGCVNGALEQVGEGVPEPLRGLLAR